MLELEPVSLLPPLPTPKRRPGAKRRRIMFISRSQEDTRLGADNLLVVAYLFGVLEFLPHAERGGILSSLDDSNTDVNADWLADLATDRYAHLALPLDWRFAAPYARRVLEAYDPESKCQGERQVFCVCVAAALHLTFAVPLTARRLLELNAVLQPSLTSWALVIHGAPSDGLLRRSVGMGR